MRANRLAGPEELQESLPRKFPREEITSALDRALVIAELLCGRPITPRKYSQTFLSEGQKVLLEAWPILESNCISDQEMQLGIVWATDNKAGTTIDYVAGFRLDSISALHKSIIEEIARWLLTKDTHSQPTEELLADYVRISRQQRAREEEQRNGR